MVACSIDQCERPAHRVGMCSAHYERNRKHGDPLAGGPLRTPKNGCVKFLKECCASDTDDCIEWPFERYENGYGRALGTTASRAVCEMVYGPAPSPDHQTAHSCNNRPCCNPRHVRWATAKENAADRVEHGTWLEGRMETNAKLSHPEVLDIYRRAKAGEQLRPLAQEYGVGYGTVQRLTTGQTWAWLTGEAA